HPRFVCHFVPTSSSWLNLVERWFRELTEKAIRRGSFVSVPELNRAIEAFLQAWNQNPKPFIWSATVEEIIKKIDRARAKMEQIKPGSTQPAGKEKGLLLKGYIRDIPLATGPPSGGLIRDITPLIAVPGVGQPSFW